MARATVLQVGEKTGMMHSRRMRTSWTYDEATVRAVHVYGMLEEPIALQKKHTETQSKEWVQLQLRFGLCVGASRCLGAHIFF